MVSKRAFQLGMLLLVLVGTSSAHGRTWNVARDGSGYYVWIQDAVNAAASGDTIRIGPGRYTEYTVFSWGNVYVWLDGTKSLTFIGAGTEETIVGPATYVSGYTDFGFGCISGDVTVRLENLRVQNHNDYGVSMYNTNVELVGCVIDHCDTGVSLTHDIQQVLVQNCQFVNGPNSYYSTALHCRAPHVLIEDCTFGPYRIGMNLDYGGSTDVLVTDCVFDGGSYGRTGAAFTLAGGGTVQNCRFVNWQTNGFVIDDAGAVIFRDNVVENCSNIGVMMSGALEFRMYDNTVSQCGKCVFLGQYFGSHEIRHNHFSRNEAVGGYYVITPDYYPAGPFDIDFTDNYWGTMDPEYVTQWILDGNDYSEVGLYVIFEPMGDELTGVGGDIAAITPSLSAYPNPFNPQAAVKYSLLQPGYVTLRAYDVRGRLVRSLVVSTYQDGGQHELSWDGRDDAGAALPSGMYLLRLEAGERVQTFRVSIIR